MNRYQLIEMMDSWLDSARLITGETILNFIEDKDVSLDFNDPDPSLAGLEEDECCGKGCHE